MFALCFAPGLRGVLAAPQDASESAAHEATSKLLPAVMERDWLEHRLDSDDPIAKHDRLRGEYELYRQAYMNEAARRTPRLDALADAHLAHSYARIGTARELCVDWRKAIESLAAIERSFWAALDEIADSMDPAPSATLLELAQVERQCDLIDIPILNHLPETRLEVRALIRQANIALDGNSPVCLILLTEQKRRLALLRQRADAVIPCIDEIGEHLERVYRVRDDNHDELGAAHVADAKNKSFVEAGQRMYKANAALCHHARTTIAHLISTLSEPEADRLRDVAERYLYPEVFDRPDTVQQRVEAEGVPLSDETAAIIARYRSERERLERSMVRRTIEYRDTWLALTGNPLIYSPMAEFQASLDTFNEELRDLETQTLARLVND